MRELAEEAAAAEDSLQDPGIDGSGSSEETGSDEETQVPHQKNDKDGQQGKDTAEQGGTIQRSPQPITEEHIRIR